MVTKREYLEQISHLITGKRVMVTLDGKEASVELGKEPIEITLPKDYTFINKLATKPDSMVDILDEAKRLGYNYEELQLFIQRMMLYHECGHALFTSPRTTADPDLVVQNLVNFVEDARVECKLANQYPPAKNKMDLMTKIFISRIDSSFLDVPTDKKIELTKKATYLAGLYHYELVDGQPVSPVVKRMVEVLHEYENNPKLNFKHTVATANELAKLIPGLDDDEIQEEMDNIVENGGMGDTGDESFGDAVAKAIEQDHEMFSQIREGMNELKGDINDWGMDLSHADMRNPYTMRYVDLTMINYMAQTLKRIIGGKPSKHDSIEYDGYAIDIECFIEYVNSGYHEIKMYQRAGKKDNPDMFISVAIDASGSMEGGKLETAKKGAINLCLACEKVGIKTQVLAFSDDCQEFKSYFQPTLESKVGELGTMGGTNISCAVKKSLEDMSKGMIDANSKKAIILISDGQDGSAMQSAKMLAENGKVHYYMIGITSPVLHYVLELRKHGAKVYGHADIPDRKYLMKGMTGFTKDFVKHA